MKEVWEEIFAGKPYSTHTLAISGENTLFLTVRSCLALQPPLKRLKIAQPMS